MNIHDLPSIVIRRNKRIGRGHGSGKVKTAGRGTKGQKARDATRVGFEGGQLPLIKRLPLLRGKGRNRSQKAHSVPVDVTRLNFLTKEKIVTLETLLKYHMIPKGTKRAKVIGKGEVTVPLTVQMQTSKGAKAAIEKVGGTVG